MNVLARTPLSILDLAPIVQGGDAAAAFRNTVAVAQAADALVAAARRGLRQRDPAVGAQVRRGRRGDLRRCRRRRELHGRLGGAAG